MADTSPAGQARPDITPTNTAATFAAPMPGRLAWIDAARGIGIALVVLGHTLRGLLTADLLEESAFWRTLDAWVYAFHMPLFFVVAGLFVPRATAGPLGAFIADKVRVIAWPYLVWSLLQGGMMVALAGQTNREAAAADLWRIIYQPQMQFWFLYVLLLLMVGYALLTRLGVGPSLFLLIALAFYATTDRVGLGQWGVAYQVRMYVLYFAAGVLLGHAGVLQPLLGRAQLWLLTPAALIGYGLVLAAVQLGWHATVAGAPLTALAGIAATFALAAAVAQLPGTGWLLQWGRLSLEIFVAHTIASAGVRIVLLRGAGVTDPWLHLIAGVLAGLYLPIVLALVSQRARFPYLFTLKDRRQPVKATDRPTTPPQPQPGVGAGVGS